MKIPLLDIQRQLQPIRKELDAAISDVVDSAQFVLGPQVSKLENEIRAFCGTTEAIGVSSGTDALIIALKALGIGPGDEVITTPYTFFATASTIWRLGAKPVFVDIRAETFNINPESIGKAITKRTKAIVVVHLFGQMAEMDEILKVAGDIPVIEDAAQTIGATWRGKQAGSFGLSGCFSFFPSKNLGCFGDGGMIVSSDTDYSEHCKALRVHGALRTYIHEEVGLNARLDTLQAAVLSVKLPYLEKWSQMRRENAELYNSLFENSPVVTPAVHPNAVSIFNQYVIRVQNRDGLKEKLSQFGIGHSIYYPLPLHLQPCFKDLNYRKGSLPESELAAKESLALPIFSELTEDEIKYVADCVLAHCS